MKEAGISDVTLQLYPDARHELLNELNRDEVFADLRNWMWERVVSQDFKPEED
jgi:alpha-beta hydrolase superfamily lysophospholipase